MLEMYIEKTEFNVAFRMFLSINIKKNIKFGFFFF
jgi:hypothetical protein